MNWARVLFFGNEKGEHRFRSWVASVSFSLTRASFIIIDLHERTSRELVQYPFYETVRAWFKFSRAHFPEAVFRFFPNIAFRIKKGITQNVTAIKNWESNLFFISESPRSHFFVQHAKNVTQPNHLHKQQSWLLNLSPRLLPSPTLHPLTEFLSNAHEPMVFLTIQLLWQWSPTIACPTVETWQPWWKNVKFPCLGIKCVEPQQTTLIFACIRTIPSKIPSLDGILEKKFQMLQWFLASNTMHNRNWFENHPCRILAVSPPPPCLPQLASSSSASEYHQNTDCTTFPYHAMPYCTNLFTRKLFMILKKEDKIERSF